MFLPLFQSMFLRMFLRFSTLFLLLSVSAFSYAEQFVEDDQYRVHYSAFNTSLLTPENAKRYGITRSRQRGMLNIAVQRKKSDGSTVGVEAQLSGIVRHLSGTERELDFTLVTEGAAVYYLAEFLIGDGEQLYFKLKAIPVPGHPGLKISFDQPFYND